MRSPLIVVPIVGALLLAGCGGAKLDQKQTQSLLSSAVAKETGARVQSVSCPSDMKAEKGTKFTCKVTGTDKSSADLPVSVVNDAGALNFRPVPFAKPAEIAANIGAALTKRVKTKIKVTCQEITIAKAGGELTCTATDANGANNKVFVTQTDTVGNVRYRVEG